MRRPLRPQQRQLRAVAPGPPQLTVRHFRPDWCTCASRRMQMIRHCWYLTGVLAADIVLIARLAAR
jgi:hypothetical protein